VEISYGALHAMKCPEDSIHEIRRRFHRAVCYVEKVGLCILEPLPALLV
jgi:hypothetical protein